LPPSALELQDRAYRFSERWKDVKAEIEESQTFWNEFLTIFGIDRVKVAHFELRVKVLGKRGRVDLLWPGVLLVEQKSRGSSLDSAQGQAAQYVLGLSAKERPKFILVSDFERLRLLDLQNVEEKPQEFSLQQLHSKIHLFDFILGGRSQKVVDEILVNTQAAELMGELHDGLRTSGYEGTAVEVFLVRVMFCLFADHTGIFDERRTFTDYIEQHTEADGSYLGANLNEFFRILDIDHSKRPTTLGPILSGLPHVNGGLFKERFEPPTFDRRMRDLLVRCCHFDWSAVSPAIFGTMFQSVTNPEERRNLGAHYTSEINVLKVIGPLFLDELKVKMASCGNNKRALNELLVEISRLRFLDPACGCGNFLAIAYRELRKLDTEIRVRLKNLTIGREQSAFAQSMRESMRGAIDVDNFYGIEIEEFPCKVAEAALWLMDHKSNREYSEKIGDNYLRLPLVKTAVIVNNNALRLDWNEILPKEQASYVLGNPPYTGQTYRSDEQNEDMRLTFESIAAATRRHASLDYVAAWYVKAAQYIQGTGIRVAFVSTKSITQGEQVGPLWSILLDTYKVKIQFAHRTFKWSNEAKGRAAVHCVIVGFGLSEATKPAIFEYASIESEPHRVEAKHINPYLVDAPDVLLFARSRPLCPGVPEGRCGNEPIDDQNYLFSEEEKDAFLAAEPRAAKYMRPWVGAREFINGVRRYCLWVGDASPAEIRSLPAVMERVEAVRRFRLASKNKVTRDAASTPRRFFYENMPAATYLLIPETSSERRKYIPTGFLPPEYLASKAVHVFPRASLFHFGVLSSAAHMAWVRTVCGRMKSDYRYSVGVVSNNFPWPFEPTQAQRERVEERAKSLLSVRAKLVGPGVTLADLYDPDSMPAELANAHRDLDLAVDRCYRPKPFRSDTSRIRFLFSLYLRYAPPTTPLEQFDFDDPDET
jgi:hypothetical protein